MGVQFAKEAFGDTGAIVECPAAYLGIELGNERGLRCSDVLTGDVPCGFGMSLDPFCARFDDGLVAGLTAIRASAILADGILPNVEPQEVKADCAFISLEGMGQARLAGLDF